MTNAAPNANPNAARSRSGGQILVDQLKIHGADLAFCVPGESFLPVLDALHAHRDSIRLNLPLRGLCVKSRSRRAQAQAITQVAPR